MLLIAYVAECASILGMHYRDTVRPVSERVAALVLYTTAASTLVTRPALFLCLCVWCLTATVEHANIALPASTLSCCASDLH